MSQPPDDFFAPRPKLSWNVRVIRVAALLVAVCISGCFLWFDFMILRESKTVASPISVGFILVAATVMQLLLLMPCWRAWMLRRWACLVLILLLLLLLFASFAFGPYMCLIGLFVTMFSLEAIADEWPHLKSGF